MATDQPTNRIPEARVGAILTRAAELDRNVQESVELDTIRAAAVEAGISLSAVDRALEEYAAGSAPDPLHATAPTPGEAKRLRRWLVKFSEAVKFGGLGIIMGIFATRGEAGVLAPSLGLILVALYLILRHRPTRDLGQFFQLITITFAGSLVVLGGENGYEDIAGWTAMLWGALLPAGVIGIKGVAGNQALRDVQSTSS